MFKLKTILGAAIPGAGLLIVFSHRVFWRRISVPSILSLESCIKLIWKYELVFPDILSVFVSHVPVRVVTFTRKLTCERETPVRGGDVKTCRDLFLCEWVHCFWGRVFIVECQGTREGSLLTLPCICGPSGVFQRVLIHTRQILNPRATKRTRWAYNPGCVYIRELDVSAMKSRCLTWVWRGSTKWSITLPSPPVTTDVSIFLSNLVTQDCWLTEAAN